MKKWLILAVVVLLVFAGIYLVLSYYAVKFIQTRVDKAIGPGFTIAQVKVKTTYLSIRGIRFEDPRTGKTFLQVDEMRIYPNLPSVLRKRLHLREWRLLKPSFFFYRTQEDVLIGPWISVQKEEKSGDTPDRKERREGEGKREREREKEKEKETTPVKIDRLRIEKGAVDFFDLKEGEVSGPIRLKEVELNMENIVYPPVSSRSPIELKGGTKGKTKTGEVVVRGWVDLRNSDLETSLNIREVELKTFEPYYRKRVSAEVESGYVNMDATVTIKNRKVDAPGHLELSDLQIKGEGTVFYLSAETLVSLLKKRGNRINAPFHVKGNMDDPHFKLQEVLLTQVAFSLAEALGLPIKRKGTRGLEEGIGMLEELFKKRKSKR